MKPIAFGLFVLAVLAMQACASGSAAPTSLPTVPVPPDFHITFYGDAGDTEFKLRWDYPSDMDGIMDMVYFEPANGTNRPTRTVWFTLP